MNSTNLLPEISEGNKMISKCLMSAKASAIGRFGSVESNLLAAITSEKTSRHNKWQAWVNAGISYPTKSVLNQFSESYKKSIESLDGLAVWPSNLLPSQDSLISGFLPNSSFKVPLRCLDPVQMIAAGLSSDQIWTQTLRDKNVLVIHSFSDLIKKQYSKNETLHRFKILPKFNLSTLTPPVTNGLVFWKGSYITNLERFNFQLEDFVNNKNIDIALVAAGGYGMPVTSKLKTLGISAVYMGGSLQILFGILGKRWQSLSELKDSRTSSWIDNPTENRPFGYKLIERGTYW